MKFVISFVLVLFYISCSGSDPGLETPSQKQKIKTGKPAESEAPSNDNVVPSNVVPSNVVPSNEAPSNEAPFQKQQKETEQPTEIRQPSQQTPPPKEPQDNMSVAPSFATFAKQLEQITGVYQKNVDVYWGWLDFWKTNLATKIVVAYSATSDILMFHMRSNDPQVSGGFCILLSDFTIVDSQQMIDRGYNDQSSSSMHTTYKAQSLVQMDEQGDPIEDAYTIMKEIRVITAADTGTLESMTVFLTNELRQSSEAIRFKSSELETQENPPNPETFFSEWRKTHPCI